MVDGGVDDIKKVMSSASKKFTKSRSKSGNNMYTVSCSQILYRVSHISLIYFGCLEEHQILAENHKTRFLSLHRMWTFMKM